MREPEKEWEDFSANSEEIDEHTQLQPGTVFPYQVYPEPVLEKLHVVYEDIEFMDALSGMTEEELMSEQGANAVVTEGKFT